MSQQPEHYTPQYLPNPNQRNPFAPSYGLGATAGRPVYVVHQKSLLISYLLWFFVGVFGGHKLYLRQPFMALLYLTLHGLAWLLMPIGIGLIFAGLLGILMFVDLFTMPIRVGIMNALARPRMY
ncbi:TM2 domain-containing protein [Rothia sp. LK2588]|uniref:TM2 domain-containing protein n=1 Tax=Rothia sp. LK2588 TaxID=3114369 RepID=UPI0034CFA6B7